MALIIVESPTKARTFNRILKDKGFFVFATMGHIRDLPASKMAVDFEKNFKPDYQIIKNKQKIVTQLKKLGKENKEVILATDPDREGESISYHAAYILGFIKEKWPEFSIKEPFKRIVFHEITQRALEEALAHPETLRLNLVKAQQARRILDRVVGYKLSPLLWKKMGKNWLSAGRVQTVALRIIVEREKEIGKFKIEDYYKIIGTFNPTGSELELLARLVMKDGQSYEQKFKLELFAGEYTYTKTTILKDKVDDLKKDVESDSYTVSSVKEESQLRYPPPPFTTSLLQQEGFQKHSFSSKMTMRLAQDLYERGHITYHRTDSFNLSTQFVFRAKDFIEATYGKEYALEKPRGFHTKSKMAQEAHEAIRPTHLEKAAELLGNESKLSPNHKKLYKLIFDRAVSTQMKEASINHITVSILGKKGYEFESEMQKVVFDGFLKVLNPEFVTRNQAVSPVKEGQQLTLKSLEAKETKTQPPPRYNEASLIKILEERGIGRPSTYAPIISLIQEKIYVEKDFRVFTPSKLGTAISDYLSEAFPQLFNLDFTAQMEDNLDKVAEGEEDFIKLLSTFYSPFEKEIEIKQKDTKMIEVDDTLDEKCPKDGGALTVRFSKFGKFIACSNYPKCKFTKPYLYFVPNKFCPKDNGRLTVRFTKTRKKFYGCENYPKCDYSTWTLWEKKDDAVKKTPKDLADKSITVK